MHNDFNSLFTGQFFMLFCHLSISVFPKNLQGIQYERVSNSLEPNKNVGPDLGPNCLQRLSADDTNG